MSLFLLQRILISIGASACAVQLPPRCINSKDSENRYPLLGFDFASLLHLFSVPSPSYTTVPPINLLILSEWQNSIIIFDEAHNLERIASDAASCSISSTDIAVCIQELQQVLSILKDSVDLNASAGGEGGGGGDGGGERDAKPTLHHVISLLKAMFEFERKLEEVPLQTKGPGNDPCAVFSGNWLGEVLDSAGVKMSVVSLVL